MQVQFVNEAAIEQRQLRIARELHDPVVKCEVGVVIPVDVAARHRRLHYLDERLQLRGLRRCRFLSRAAAGELIEHSAKLEDVVRFLDADLADEHAAVLLEPDEAGFLERAKRLAHGAARHAKHRGHLGFAKLCTGGQITRENHPLDLALDECRQRVRLQECDRVVVSYRAWRAREIARCGGGGRRELWRIGCGLGASAR